MASAGTLSIFRFKDRSHRKPCICHCFALARIKNKKKTLCMRHGLLVSAVHLIDHSPARVESTVLHIAFVSSRLVYTTYLYMEYTYNKIYKCAITKSIRFGLCGGRRKVPQFFGSLVCLLIPLNTGFSLTYIYISIIHIWTRNDASGLQWTHDSDTGSQKKHLVHECSKRMFCRRKMCVCDTTLCLAAIK